MKEKNLDRLLKNKIKSDKFNYRPSIALFASRGKIRFWEGQNVKTNRRKKSWQIKEKEVKLMYFFF